MSLSWILYPAYCCPTSSELFDWTHNSIMPSHIHMLPRLAFYDRPFRGATCFWGGNHRMIQLWGMCKAVGDIQPQLPLLTSTFDSLTLDPLWNSPQWIRESANRMLCAKFGRVGEAGLAEILYTVETRVPGCNAPVSDRPRAMLWYITGVNCPCTQLRSFKLTASFALNIT